MRKIMMPAAALLLCVGVPPVARAQTVAQVEQQINAVAAWQGRVVDALDVANRAFEKFDRGMDTLSADLGDPDKGKANAVRIRALAAEARDGVRQSNALLAAIPPLSAAFARVEGFDLNRIRTEALEQNERNLDVLVQIDTVADAIESGNPIEVNAVLPRLFEASFVSIDNQVLTVRNRMASLPADEPTRQALGIIGLVYRMMAVVSRGWVRAQIEGKSEEAEAMLTAELKKTGSEYAALVAAGRAYLARKLKEIDSRLAITRDPKARALLERVKVSRILTRPMFDIGDELGRLTESASADPKAALAGADHAALMTPLIALEQRFIALNVERTAAIQPAAR